MLEDAGKPVAPGLLLPVGVMFSALVAAGCVATPAPQEMARTTLNTAPADLQLLCANAAAGSLGVDSARVLPTNSRQLDSRTYQVDLDAGGANASCIIDDDGNVKSVQPA